MNKERIDYKPRPSIRWGIVIPMGVALWALIGTGCYLVSLVF